MGASSTARSRGRRWIVLWVLFFAGLVAFLPRRPVRRVENTGPIGPMRFADSNTLLLSSNGFSVLDLRDGSLQPLKEPVYDDEPVRTEEDLEREKATRFYDQLWDTHSAGPRFGLRGIAGDHFVLARPRGVELRVSVRNWRTGEEAFYRNYLNGDVWVAGDRVYVEWVTPGTTRAQLDVWDMATGDPVPAPGPPERLAMRGGQVSPDGQYLAAHGGYSKLRLWSLTGCRDLFTAQGELFAFSSDSRHLAVTLREKRKTRRRDEIPRRILRVYDMGTGEVVAERTEAGAALETDEILAFHDEDRCVVIYARNNSSGTRCPKIDVWRWEADALQTLRSTPGYQGPKSVVLGPPIAPRFVLDEDRIVDVATGLPLCTLATPNPQLVTSAPGWIVLRSSGGRPADRLAALVKPYSTPLAEWIAAGDAAELCDLTGQTVALLGKGRPVTLFSPDGRWLVTRDPTSIEIWQLPPSRPWFSAFAISLVVPLLAGFREWQRRRREGREPETA